MSVATLQATAENIFGNVSDPTGKFVQHGDVQIEAWSHRYQQHYNTHVDDATGDYELGVDGDSGYVMYVINLDTGYWGATTMAGSEDQPTYEVYVNPGDDLTGYDFEIREDNIPPVIIDVQIEGTPKAGEDIVISMEVTDDGGSTANGAWFQARRVGEEDWPHGHWGFGPEDDGRWRLYIPSWLVTTAGVEYYVAVYDYAENHTYYPIEGWDNPEFIPVEQPSDAIISGTVTDDSDPPNPLKGAWVEAWRNEDDRYAAVHTDENGYYTLEVAAGTWSIWKPGLHEFYPVEPPHRPDPVNEPYHFVHVYPDIPVNVGDALTGYNVMMAHDPTPPEIWFDITVLPSNGITIAAHVDDPESGVYGDWGNAEFQWRFMDWGWNWDDRNMGDWKYDPIEENEVRDGVFERQIHFGRTGIIEYFFEAWNAAGMYATNPSPRPDDNPEGEHHGYYAPVIAGYSTQSASYFSLGNTYFDGNPVGYGRIITAADPDDGELCGGFIVGVSREQANPGDYGYMTIYGNDPFTGDFDEGIEPPDEAPIFFMFDEENRVNMRVLEQYVTGDDATWSENAVLEVDLQGFSAVKKVIPVERNWNLIGTGGIPADGDTSVESVLRSIEHQCYWVIGYDPGTGEALLYGNCEDAGFNTLTDLDDVHGFYLFPQEHPDTLVVKIIPTPPETPIPVYAEQWNLVTYLPGDERLVPDALTSINGQYDWVEGFYPLEGGRKDYNPNFPELSTLESMKQPFSYFILMNTDADLTFDMPALAPPARKEKVNKIMTLAATKVRDVIPTTSMVFFYGGINVDGQPAPAGTQVSAYDSDGVKAGKFVVREAGKFGYMPVYQDERITTNVDEGAKPGEMIRFTINDQTAVADKVVVWTKFGDRIRLNLDATMPVIPKEFALLQNYPNPFNPETWIPYQIPQDTGVVISIYNIKGQLIRTLHLGQKPAGMYTSKERAAYWNGKDEHGEMVSSGVYFYNIQAGDFRATRKLVVLK